MSDKKLDELWEKVKANSKKQQNCTYHEFKRIEDSFGSDYICKNCGCVEPVKFVLAYRQGLEHGRGGK